MAKIPTPSSYNQILGTMLDTFVSNLKNVKITKLKVGGPILSILEAAAQSDMRSTQNVFNMLSINSLDNTSGLALDRIGQSEGFPRILSVFASGSVTITDGLVTKKSTNIYQGKPAPIAGSTAIYVNDASAFPATGSIYIGRNTSNYEGPLSYTSITNNGLYYTINLDPASATQKFHNLTETVILAQGGNRTIPRGTVVQTTQSNLSSSVQFSVLYAVTIPDGEDTVEGALVVCQTPGTIGNVSDGEINSFPVKPFTGAIVTNPTPFTNGLNTETDDAYRERIRNLRQSRQKGTELAISTNVLGIVSPDENKRVTSVSFIKNNFGSTLYIDDGTGYEEQSTGIAQETLIDNAVGGEQYFTLSSAKPVTKAFVKTSVSAPFTLIAGSQLAVKVGGVLTVHTFSDTDFKAIDNATAYEVAASINADANLNFRARTSDSGTTITIMAASESNEQVEVVSVASPNIDANTQLGFTATATDTVLLYRDDKLLYKDGLKAIIESVPVASWGSFSGSQTLTVAIDGTASVQYTLSDQDFIDAGTAYTTLSSSNSMDAWASVFNYKIPGITATVANDRLILTSNLGASSRASIAIAQTGSSLVTNGMFSAQTVTGKNNDYTINRNTGQICLTNPLAAGSKLTAGSNYTAGFIESGNIGTQTLTSNAELWFVVDGAPAIVKAGLNASVTLSYTVNATPSWGKRIRITASSSAFSNVKVGDWVIFWDPIFAATEKGAFRVANVASTYIDIARESTYTPPGSAITLASNGVTFVRTAAPVQKAVITGSTGGTLYSATNFVNSLNSQLVGATATVYRSNKIRISTNTLDNGDITLVAVNAMGQKLQLPVGSSGTSVDTHVATIASGNSQIGTPTFVVGTVSAESTTTNTFNVSNASTIGLSSNSIVAGLKNLPDSATLARSSNHLGFATALTNLATNTLNLRNSDLDAWLAGDRFFAASSFKFSPDDSLLISVDGDSAKRYNIPMYRRLKPTTSTYGATNSFTDTDNGGKSLAAAFGTSFDFTDFIAYMKARAITHSGTDHSILWRYYQFGKSGNNASVAYNYATAANQGVAISVKQSGTTNVINIKLPSGAARTPNIHNGTKVGVCLSGPDAGGLYTYEYIFGYSVTSASRTSNVTTLTLDITTPNVTAHGFAVNNVIYVNSNNASFSSGQFTITSIGSNTISYSETAADQAATANIGTVSYDTQQADLTTVVAGDIVTVSQGSSGLPSPYIAKTMKIATVGTQYFTATSDTNTGSTSSAGTNSTTPSWYALVNASGISFYPTAAASANAIATAVNAYTNSPVSATVLGTGTGLISQASYDELDNSNPATALTDGVNYIQTSTYPAPNYNLTFKDTISASLSTGANWEAEEIRLVPSTAKNVVDYLNSAAVGGLFTAANVTRANDARKVQIATKTNGSSGSVQVLGGSANAVSIPVVGSATYKANTASWINVKTNNLIGFAGGMWVALQNSVPMPKSIFTSNSKLLSIDNTTGWFTFDSGYIKVWTQVVSPIASVRWQVEKHGKFIAYTNTGLDGAQSLSGLNEGDWVEIQSVTGADNTFSGLSSVNVGNFRVVRVDTASTTFWVENSNAVEEIGYATMYFRAYNSVMPGDKLIISTPVWNNVGQWTIKSVDDSNQYRFQVDITSNPLNSYTGTSTLNSNYQLVQVVESAPTRLIKQIAAIAPDLTTTDQTKITLTTDRGYANISAVAGTQIEPLDKFGFDTSLKTGVDAYRYSTGLVGEAIKVMYGDKSDTLNYPGVVAAGSNIYVYGPLIKRIQVALALRVRSKDVISKVQAAVGSVINSCGIGESVAISSIVNAASSIPGVIAVSIISPSYDPENDLIPVQPFEKPRVLNLDEDISISIVGE